MANIFIIKKKERKYHFFSVVAIVYLLSQTVFSVSFLQLVCLKFNLLFPYVYHLIYVCLFIFVWFVFLSMFFLSVWSSVCVCTKLTSVPHRLCDSRSSLRLWCLSSTIKMAMNQRWLFSGPTMLHIISVHSNLLLPFGFHTHLQEDSVSFFFPARK